jgi:hypothetical protein
MKTIITYINEKLKIRPGKTKQYFPKARFELQDLMFKLIKERGNDGDFNDIDTSHIKDMSWLFSNGTSQLCTDFNGDISEWDVSNVVDMRNMFEDCPKFEGKGLEKWDISSCTNFTATFKNCHNLEGDKLESWQSKMNKTTPPFLKSMFRGCKSMPTWYSNNL